MCAWCGNIDCGNCHITSQDIVLISQETMVVITGDWCEHQKTTSGSYTNKRSFCAKTNLISWQTDEVSTDGTNIEEVIVIKCLEYSGDTIPCTNWSSTLFVVVQSVIYIQIVFGQIDLFGWNKLLCNTNTRVGEYTCTTNTYCSYTNNLLRIEVVFFVDFKCNRSLQCSNIDTELTRIFKQNSSVSVSQSTRNTIIFSSNSDSSRSTINIQNFYIFCSNTKNIILTKCGISQVSWDVEVSGKTSCCSCTNTKCQNEVISSDTESWIDSTRSTIESCGKTRDCD